MLPTKSGYSYYHPSALMRVFSGTLTPGKKVGVLEPNHMPGSQVDICKKKVQKISQVIHRSEELVSMAVAGSICAVTGIDYFVCSGYSLVDDANTMPVRANPHVKDRVLNVEIMLRAVDQMPLLAQNLKMMAKIHTSIWQDIDDDKAVYNVKGGTREEIDIALKFVDETLYTKSEIFTEYRETAGGVSDRYMGVSPNKHNRLLCSVEPMPEKLVAALLSGQISMNMDNKVLSQKLAFELIDC